MTSLSIMGLVPQPAGRIEEGSQILYRGENLLEKSAAEMRQIRGKEICMILQDPMTSLNPVYTVGNQVIETLRQNDADQRSTSLKDRAIELLSKVKIPAPDSRFTNFPPPDVRRYATAGSGRHRHGGCAERPDRRRSDYVPGRYHSIPVPSLC